MRLRIYTFFLFLIAALYAVPTFGQASVTIQQPVASTTISCAGVNDGTITIRIDTAGGVKAPFTYTIIRFSPTVAGCPITQFQAISITTNELSATFKSLCPGLYVPAAQDNSDPAVNDPNSSLLVTSVGGRNVVNTALNGAGAVTNVTCNGDASGSIKVVGSGGTNSIFDFELTGPSFPSGSGFVGSGNKTHTFNGLLAGDYSIVARDANGCIDPTPLTVTISQPSALSSAFTVSSNVVCTGKSITVTYNGSNGIATYNWDFDGGVGLPGNGVGPHTLSFATAGTKNVTLQVIDNTGCVSSTTTQTITVNQSPSLVITNPAAVCTPTTVDLTAPAITVGSTGNGTLTYWTDAAATIALASPNAVTTSGTYYIKSTTAEGCADTKPVSVTVNQSPSLVITNPAAVCTPATVNLTAPAITAGSTGNGTLTYWTDAAATNALSNPAAVSISGTYYIQSTTSAGCTDIKPVTVTINQSPSLVITNPAAVCTPTTVDLTAASVTAGSTGNGTLTYWTNAAATNALSNPSAVVTSGTYYIKSTVATGCTDIKPVTVTVNASPSLVITNPAAVCTPATVNLAAPAVTAGSTGGGTLTYWTDAAATNPLSSPNAVVTSGTYYIKSTTGAGCIDIKPVTVTINTSPSLVINNPAAVCAPASVDLTAAAITAGSTGGGTLTYWTDAAATNPLSSPNAVVTSGTYYIKSTTGTGCIDIKPVTVTINTPPSLVITNPAAVCAPATVDLTAPAVTAGSIGSGTLTYWTNAAATITLSSPNAVTTSGTYYIKSTNGAGCTDIKSVTVTVNPAPTLVVNNPAAVCAPATVDLTAASVTAGSTGGTTFTYWTNSTATTALSGPATVSVSGTYYIKSTNASGCFSIMPVTVSINPAPMLVINNPAAVCSPATVNLTAAAVTAGSTGTGTLTYWTDAAATNPLSNPSAVSTSGTYYIKSTTGAGCTDVKPVTVTINTSPSLVINNPAAVCTPATVNLAAPAVTAGSMGGGTLTYWTDAAATNALSNPSAVSTSGTYYIKSTTGAGCIDIKPVTVTINALPVLVINNPAAVCAPASVDLTAAAITAGSTGGGTLSYWTDAAATVALSSPTAVSTSGTYYIKTTTAGGCTDVKPVTVTVNPMVAAPTVSPVQYCQNNVATALTAGGTNLLWYTAATGGTGSATAPTPVTTSAGTFNFYVSQTVNGCESPRATLTVTVHALPVLTVTNPSAVCAPATVDLTAASVTAGSASGTLTYWTDAAATNALSNPSAVVTSGTYYIKLVDANGCATIQSVAATINATPVATINYQGSPYCINDPNPSPTLGSGAVAGTFSATPAGLSIDASTGVIDLTTSLPGNYTVTNTVTLNGCTGVSSTPVKIKDSPKGDFAYAGSPYCQGSTAIVAPTFSGAGEAGAFSASPAGLTINASTGVINLATSAAGTYTVTNTVSSGGCTASSQTTVVISPAPVLNITNPAAVCAPATVDLTQLAVTAGSTGGGPLTYWTDVAATNALSNPSAVATSGTYYIKSTTGAGCTDIKPVTVTIRSVNLTAVVTNSTNCTTPNGSITLTVSGGATPYSYAWSHGANTQNVAGLSAGTYTVVVTDVSGCSATLTRTISDPAGMTLTASAVNSTNCTTPNGSITLTVNGGTAPFTYLWSNNATTKDLNGLSAGTYLVTVTDANGCTASISQSVTDPAAITLTASVINSTSCTTPNGSITLTVNGGTAPFTYSWSHGPATKDVAGLSAGTYTVTVRDANGCTATLSRTITDPAGITLSASTTNSTNCNTPNGSITLTVSGGTAPYNYAWSQGATTKDVTGLSAGTYTVVVTDASGCTATITRTISDPAGISLSAVAVNSTNCTTPNGSITLTVTGGVAPITYNWGNGVTTKDRTGLSAGSYTVVVTDANGCSATLTRTITDPAGINLSATSVNSSNCVTPNGSITLTVSGGNAPFTYLWSNNATTQNLTSLSAGTYTVTVTDASGCTATLSRTIADPAGMGLTASITNSTNCATPNGAINLTVSGGTAPYTYLWNNNATTQNLSGLGAGTYSVTVTDANGCKATLSRTITEPNGISLAATVSNSTSCTTPNGGITLIVNGGTAPFTYSWSHGPATKDVTSLSAGTYTVTVRDANGCTATLTRTITDPAGITLSATSANSSSCITPNGSISLTVNGGVAPYTYLWSNGETTQNVVGLAAGNYSVTVTDANGCTATLSRIITDPSGLSLSVAAANSTNCATPNGSVTLTVNGGTAPFTYSWSNNAATKDLTGLSAGTYTVVVTDAGGCTATISATVTDPAGITLTANSLNSTNCTSPNGAIAVSVSGGIAPYSFVWGNGETTQNLTGLNGGTYTVTVRDANGCTATLTRTITDPAGITLTASAVNATDCQTANGSITLTVSGGVAPYTYTWSNGANTQNVANLAAGTYSVTVTDANGCSASLSRTITAPANTINLSASTTNSTNCTTPNGTITLTVTGGTVPFTYLWSNGPTTQNLSGLSAGTYSVTVRDANGCQATLSRTILDPAGMTLTASVSNSTSCTSPNGSINLTVNGGVAPYTYLWSNGATTQNVANLAAGTYSVTVTDANGCKVTLSRSLTDPAGMVLSAVAANVTDCTTPNGSIQLNITGGTVPFTYLWSNGPTTQNLSGLSAGTYSVIVRDANGCQATLSQVISPANCNPACTLAATASATNATSCTTANGSITLTVSGGTTPYTYSWSNGANTQNLTGLSAGTYTVTVTDANGCKVTVTQAITDPAGITLTASTVNSTNCATPNGSITLTVSSGAAPYTYLWSNGANMQNLTGLSAGTYTVTVTDANGCTATLTRTITDPAGIILAGTTSNSTSCSTPNGSISLTVSGGVAPYTYAWNNGAITQNLTGLAAGTYIVTVTDANGCTATLSQTITDPSGISLTASTVNSTNCTMPNGSIMLNVSGGAAPYTYLWSNGATTQNLSGLSAGTYSVTVRDANGCQATLTRTITDPAGITLMASGVNSTNCISPNGRINLTVSGGSAPYTYLWSNGATTQNLTGLAAGTYTVTVTDVNGCKATISRVITDPAGILLSASASNSTNCTVPNGSITVSVAGGTAPFTYLWSNSATTKDLTGLSAGNYTVTVTDANGCSFSLTTTITDPAGMTLTASTTNSTNCTTPNGLINLTVSGGVAPYTYAWNNGATTQNLSGLTAGTYTVTVTDANGCKATLSRTITDPSNITLAATSVSSTSCTTPNGSINLTVNGGVAPFTYLWSNGATTQNLTGLAAGTYTVVVKDANGCQATLVRTITDPAGITLTASVSNSTSCTTPNGSLNLTVNGSTAPYKYLWSNGATTQSLTGLSAGNYTVTVTDANGCTATLTRIITDPAGITLTASVVNSTNCLTPNGSINLTINGGVAPYTYLWSNGATTQNVSNLAAGTYTVTVTDANGCKSTLTQMVTDPAGISLSITGVNSTDCAVPNGSLTLSVNGGVAPYTYLWSNGATTQNLNGLSAGTYTVTVRDANGCQATLGRTITDPNCPPTCTLAVTVSATNSTSCTVADGSITLNVSGGTTPYTYLWNNGATTQNLSGLAAGTYSVTVRDASGCVVTVTQTISDPAGITLSVVSANSTDCAAPNGSLTLTVNGGVAPYTYLWNTGATTADLSGLSAGTYSVTVRDANGCQATLSRTITDPNCTPTCTMTASAAGTNSTNCVTPNGSITLTVNGGTAPYTYLWSNGATTQSLNGLSAGTYTVTVRDANGCTATSNAVTITNPSTTTASVSISASATTVCAGTAITFTATATNGGSAPTYQWRVNGSPVAGATNATFTSSTLSNNDQVSVIMTAGGSGTACISGSPATSNSVAITISNSLTASVSITADQTTVCAGTAITFTATPANGGSAPTYQWLVNGVSAGASATGATFTSNTLTNNDRVTVIMTAGGSGTACISGSPATSNSVAITISNSLTASVSITADQTTVCAGTAITFTATATNGGSAPTYQWRVNGVNVNGATSATFTSSTLSNNDQVSVVMTAGGTGLGCINGSPATSNAVAVTISNSLNAGVSIAASASGPFCSGSSITFTATATNGGTAPAYQWKVNGVNVNGATNATFTSSTLSNNDVVTVTMTPDVSGSNSCVNPAAVTSNAVTVSVKAANDPSCNCNLVAMPSSNPVTCQGDRNGEAIAFVLSGGSGQYLYQLNGGTPVALDQILAVFRNQPFGRFSIQITDRNNTNCTTTVTGDIGALVTLVAQVNATDPTCVGNDGKIEFAPFQTGNGGGRAPYQISIDGGRTFTQTATGAITFSNLTAGTYNVVVSDGTPCTTSFAVKLNAVSTQITPTVTISTPSPTVCTGQPVTFTASVSNGGNVPRYQWRVNGVNVSGATASTFTTSTLTASDVVTLVMTPDLSGAGSCINPAPVTSNSLSVTPSSSLTPSVTISTPNSAVCSGAAVTFTATPTNGGTNPVYQWRINNVNVSGANASTFTTSTLTSTDVVTVVMTPDVSGTGSCIQPGAVTSNGLSVSISNSINPTVSIATPASQVCVGTPVTFTATANNGGNNPTYQWRVNGVNVAGATNATFTTSTLSSSDVVTVVMTPDQSGGNSCINPAPVTSNSLSVTVSSSLTASVSVSASATSICVGGTVTFTATATNGGTSPTYQWKINGVNVAGATAATFSSSTLNNNDQVTVAMTPDRSGSNSCVNPGAANSSAVSITVKPANDPSCGCNLQVAAQTTNAKCEGDRNGEALVFVVQGGSGSYEYRVGNGAYQDTPNFTGLTAGTYVFTVRDKSTNCVGTTTVSLSTQFVVSGLITRTPPANCNDKGSIQFTTITGTGTAPYQVSVDGINFVPYTASPTPTTFNGLEPGDYRTSIRDANGCVFTVITTIEGVAPIIANLSKTDVKCFGASNGVVTISNPSGGANNGYVYSMDGTNYSGTTSFTGLRAGSYTFYVKDANGTCLQTFPVTLSEPAQMVATVNSTQPASCQVADGQIAATVTSGGVAPFEYQLNTGNFQTASTFTGLGNGTYTVTIRDANGCVVTRQVSLTSTGAVTATATVISDASCNRADGSAQITNVTGGSGNYEYSKDGITYQDSPLFSNLRSGNYLLIVRDKGVANGCTASYPVSIRETLQVVATVTATRMPGDCQARDGEITVSNVSGGQPAYQYSLDSLMNYQTSAVFTGLGNGNYKVYVRDSRGCLGVYSVSLTSPNAISVGNAISVVSPSCAGMQNGRINMNTSGSNVTGGQPGYLYSLNGGAFQTSPLFSNLAAGAYQVKVKDQAGCELAFAYTLTDPAGLNFEVVQTTSAGCGGEAGAVEVRNVGGGIAPYAYSINGIDFQAGASFANLTAGSYTMYVRDASLQTTCITSKTFNVLGSTKVTFDLSTTDIGCEGGDKGRITIKNIVGGVPAVGPARYKVSINGGQSFRDVTGDSLVFDNLRAGNYEVILTYGENLGCSSTPRPVTIASAGIFFEVKTTAATCGEANGKAEAVVPNASANYSYSLEPNTGFRPSPIFTDLRPGVYTMYIRTGAVETCPNQMTFRVPGPAKLEYTFKKNNSCEGDKCQDSSGGSIVFSDIKGGVLPYKVSVDNGANFTYDIYQNNFAVTGLKPGDYQIIVADAAGCKTLAVPVKIEESRMRARLRVEPSQLEEPTGSVWVQDIRGGTPVYEVSIDGFTWAPVRSSKGDTLITGISVGRYKLFIRDANGCMKCFEFNIEESKFVIPNIFTPNGDTYNDTFRIRNLPDGSVLSIVNRWGKVVYQTSSYQNDWDGGTLPDGVYYYTLNVPGKGPYTGWVEIRRTE